MAFPLFLCFEDDRPLLVYREWFSILVYTYLGVLLDLLHGLFSLHLGLLQLRLHLSQLGQHIGEEIFWVKSSFELLGQQCSVKPSHYCTATHHCSGVPKPTQ